MESAALPAAPSAAQRAPGRRRLSDRARAERKTAYLLCAPAVVVMAAGTGYPILYALWLSLHKFDLRLPSARRSVRLDNLCEVLSSTTRWQDVLDPVILPVLSVTI